MKKVKEIIFIVSESEEGGYEAKALDFPIFTQGETIEELKEMIKDAVKCHFEVNEIPEIINLHIVKDEVLTL
jgi:predicted RNase H-like HicB family nuclease